MGRIVIIEEKADKMINKLEKVKSCVEEVIDCFTECMDGSDDYQPVGYNRVYPMNKSYYPMASHNDEWDDEYEVKRRRGNRKGYEPPEKVMRMYNEETRY